MRLIKVSFFVFFAMLFFAPFFANAAQIMTNLDISLSDQKKFEENLYIGGGNVFVESDVDGDLVVFGGEVSIKSNVSGDIFLMGGKIDFSGNVDGDLRIFGGEVKISGIVGGDVLVLGAIVEIAESAQVNKEIFVVGGRSNIKNTITEKLKIISGNVSLNSVISGKTEITTQSLKIYRDSDISGDFYYYAPQKFYIEQDAIISGKVSFNEINSFREMGIVKKAILSFLSFWFLLRFITTLIISFVLIYVFKVFTQSVTDLALNSFGKSFLVGILALFFAPIIIALLIVSLVGLPIGFLLLLALVFIIIISPAVSGIILGIWLMRIFKKDITKSVDFQSATIGVIFLTLLQFVPYIGGPLRFVLIIVSLGVILRQIRLNILK